MTLFVSLRLLWLPPGREDEAAAVAATLARVAPGFAGVGRSWAAPVAGGATINAGQVVWRTVFATERDALAVPADPLWRREVAPLVGDGTLLTVGYRTLRGEAGIGGPGIWRALIFRVVPHAPSELTRTLEERTMLMPRHIRAIRGWNLGRVAHGDGPKAYTHVWEQEFDRVEALTGPYMDHPLHWGVVDAFFDADCPEYIVDPQLIQVVGAIGRGIL